MQKILDLSDMIDKNEFTFSEKTDKIFSSNSRRHEDLKEMLDGNKDGLKLDAMKRIIGMVAKGKNASHLFPSVVKNVACKNLEVKKLVYVYLVRYAEEQQDLALLSISTFQKGLKDHNPLIRASALRVLSSIRVQMISPIMMLAIKEGMRDMSPYVRKTAALALPKLYQLEPELKEILVELIEHGLSDKSSLVIGSAIMAYEIVCPEREDIIKRIFSKLIKIFSNHFHHPLVHNEDQSGGMDEWSICQILYTLTRFASRRLLIKPNASDDSQIFLKISDIHKSEDGDEMKKQINYQNGSKMVQQLDIRPKCISDLHPDLKTLLKSSKYLLQSRNSAVVMSVIQLYYHCSPYEELGIIIKPLIRLLHSYSEVQSIVLKNIISLCRDTEIKGLFEPYLKSFFVNHNDATHIKLLKLEIFTALANESNIALILRELQAYVTSEDKDFASATIVCIGQCAQNIPSIKQSCTNGLLNLIYSSNERVVSESVIVLKDLLKLGDKSNAQAILNGMCKILVDSFTLALRDLLNDSNGLDIADYSHHELDLKDSLHISSNGGKNTTDNVRFKSNLDSKAISCIIWLLCQYGDEKTYVQMLPDLLRILAKCFVYQDIFVKLQIVSMAAKLYSFLLSNPQICFPNTFGTSALIKIEPLIKYIFELAKYDTNYDLRDKTRFYRNLLFGPKDSQINDSNNSLKKNLLTYLGSTDAFQMSGLPLSGHDNHIDLQKQLNANNAAYQLGSLSHYLNTRIEGYRDMSLNTCDSKYKLEEEEKFGDIDWWAIDESPPGIDELNQYSPSASFTSFSNTDQYYSSRVSTAMEATDSNIVNNTLPDSLINHKEKQDKYDYEKFLGNDEDDDNDHANGEKDKDAPTDNSLDESDTSTPETSLCDDDEDDEISPSNNSKPLNKSTGPQSIQLKSSVFDPKMNSQYQVMEGSSSIIDDLLNLDFGDPNLSSANVNINIQQPTLSCNVSSSSYSSPKTLNQGYQEIPPLRDNADIYIKLDPIVSSNAQQSEPPQFELYYRLTRKPYISNNQMVNVELKFHSLPDNPNDITNIQTPSVDRTKIAPIYQINKLNKHSPVNVLANMGINFNDSIQPVKFKIQFDVIKSKDSNDSAINEPSHLTYDYALNAPLGEQIYPIFMTSTDITKEQKSLSGMNETNQIIYITKKLIQIPKMDDTDDPLIQQIQRSFNFAQPLQSKCFKKALFSAKTRFHNSLLILEIEFDNVIETNPGHSSNPNNKQAFKIKMNSEKMLLSNLFIKDVIAVLNEYIGAN